MAVPSTVRPKLSLFGRPPPRIGFLVDWLMDPYQSAVLRGARAAAEERGVSLVVLPGGVLGAPHLNGAIRNHLFRLAKPERLDAVVVLAGTLGNHEGVEGLVRFCEAFRGKPVVSIAVEVPGHSTVQVDNRAGMREVVEHLIRVHGCRRVAFIRGPRVNSEAEERYAAYRQALEDNGVPFDDALVAPGDFQRRAGEDAVRLWLDERRISVAELDAIAGAADLMVLGALDELNRRQVRVPEEVALVGFDDIEEARFTTPPLSTVRQPLFEQGHAAVRAALAQLGLPAAADRIDLPTRFVGRHSCGCLSQERADSSVPPPASRLSFEATVVSRRDVLRAELSRASRGSFSAAGAGWEDRLLNALSDELRGCPGALVSAYYQIVQSVLSAAGDLSVSHGVIGALRRQLVRAAGDDAASLREIEGVLHEMRIVTSEMLERFHANRRIQTEAWARQLSQVSARLVTSFEFEQLERAVREQLPRLGIRSCFISRYVDEEQVELMAGYSAPEAGDLPRLRYPLGEIVPHGLLGDVNAAQLVVLPLAFEEQPFGFVVFELGESEGHVYEALAEIIGAALRGAGLTALIASARESGHPLVSGG